MRFFIQNVRLAFPVLWTPAQVNGEGEPAFSGSFLLAPNHPALVSPNQITTRKDAKGNDILTYSNLHAVMEAVAKEEWKGKYAEVLKLLTTQDRTFLHSGDNKPDYDGFPGNLYVSARGKTRPKVFDEQRNDLTQADGKPYAGCYVNLLGDCWAQNNKFGKRLNAQLMGVQYARPGDAFSGGRAADASDFDDIAVAAEGDTAGLI